MEEGVESVAGLEERVLEQRVFVLIYDYVGAWNRHDAEELAGLYAEDALYEDLRLRVTLNGGGAIRRHLWGVFGSCADAVLALGAEPLAAGDRAYFEWLMVGNGDGQTQEVRGVSVMLVEDGRIVRQTNYSHVPAATGGAGAAFVEIATAVAATEDNIGWGE